VDVETDFTITGRLARFGRGGMMQDVSNRLLRDFSNCLQKTIETAEPTAQTSAEAAAATSTSSAEPAAPSASAAAPRPPVPAPARPVGGFSLFLRALLDRLRRALGRGRGSGRLS
jgi:uncharacterized protein